MNKRLKTEIQLTLKMKFSGLKVLNTNNKRQKKQKKMKWSLELCRWSLEVSWAQRPYAEVNLRNNPHWTDSGLRDVLFTPYISAAEFQLQLVIQSKRISDALKQLAFPRYLVEKKNVKVHTFLGLCRTHLVQHLVCGGLSVCLLGVLWSLSIPGFVAATLGMF